MRTTYTPSSELFHVVWDECVGYPEPRTDTFARRYRTYADRGDAYKKVVQVRAYPSHCRLVGVWQGEAAWAPIPEALIPQPEVTSA